MSNLSDKDFYQIQAVHIISHIKGVKLLEELNKNLCKDEWFTLEKVIEFVKFCPECQFEAVKRNICSNYILCSNKSKFLCSNCKLADYCSRKCQQEHWKVHKLTCMYSNNNNGKKNKVN